MGLPWYALIAAGGVLGLGLIWYILGKLQRAEQDRLELTGRKAADEGEREADVVSVEIEEKANAAKKAAGDGWTRSTPDKPGGVQ